MKTERIQHIKAIKLLPKKYLQKNSTESFYNKGELLVVSAPNLPIIKCDLTAENLKWEKVIPYQKL